MTGKLSKNFHGVGIGPLSNILAVKSFSLIIYIFFRKISKNFWHHMTVEEWEKESEVLDAFIRHIGAEAKSDEMYINGYTDPFAFNQRSELWKVKI